MSHYTCHSDNLGTAKRDTSHTMEFVKDGVIQSKEIRTKWLDIACGHITSMLDVACQGCKCRREDV